MPKLPITPRLTKLLLSAESISREMGWNYVGTEHILLALFRLPEGDGVGKQMLTASGADETKARATLEDWASGKLEQTGEEYIPEILRHQAEVHCRALRFLSSRFSKIEGRPKLYKAGHGDGGSPPYWQAASLFVKDNICDPLRTEIIWLRAQFDWIGDEE